MAKINNFDDLKSYCIRNLTGGITNIELSNEAIDDGIDDAFQLFFEFHYNGYEETFLPIVISAEDRANNYLDLNNIQDTSSEYLITETIPLTAFTTNYTSPQIYKFHYNINSNIVNYSKIVVQREVRGVDGSLTSLINLVPNAVSDGYTLVKEANPSQNFTLTLTESIDTNDKLTITESHFSGISDIIAVSDIKGGNFQDAHLRFSGGLRVGFSRFIDSMVNGGGGGGDLAYLHYSREYLSLIGKYFSKKYNYSHNAINNKLVIHQDLIVGDVLIIKAYKQLASLSTNQNITSSTGNVDIYNDRWLKAMSTAQIKRRWGWWHKYESVALPGGKSVNGQVIYDEAELEIEKLRHELELTYQDPIDFFIG